MNHHPETNSTYQGMKVLITARSFGKNVPNHLTQLRDLGIELIEYREEGPLDPEKLTELVSQVHGWVVSIAPVSEQVLSRATNLKIVVKHGVGIDNIDLQAAQSKGVTIANAPGANHIPVAELSLAMMLALGRKLCKAHMSVLEGRWERFLGTGLYGKTIGIMGFGRIGQAVAQRTLAFGTQVLVYDPFLDKLPGSFVPMAGQPIQLENNLALFLEQLDILSLNIPLTKETEGIINSKTLSIMKPGSLLVNTARGKIADEKAVYDALVSGHLGGYATDVFETEPPGSSPLLGLENVVFTPHVASYTSDAMKALGDNVLENLLQGLAGQVPANVIAS